MSKTYDPKSFENKLYKEWVDKGYFKAKADSKKEPFTIVIPPPNITASYRARAQRYYSRRHYQI